MEQTRWEIRSQDRAVNVVAVRGDGAEVTLSAVPSEERQRSLKLLRRKYGPRGERIPWAPLIEAGLVRHHHHSLQEERTMSKQEEHTKAELLAIAEERGIEVSKSWTKAKIAKTIEAASKSKSNGNGNGDGLASLAEQLTEIADEAELAKEFRAHIAKLTKNGGPSHKDLVALRDAVNEQAAALREAEQTGLASQLSAANRLVRRAERAARK